MKSPRFPVGIYRLSFREIEKPRNRELENRNRELENKDPRARAPEQELENENSRIENSRR
jgi:hypothetical protein